MKKIEVRKKEIEEKASLRDKKILKQRDFITKKFKKENYGVGRENLYKEFSNEEIAELDRFWSRTNHIYRPDYKSIEPFYNISGIFDSRYIPYEFMENYLRPQFYNEAYRAAFQDKTYLSEIFSNVKQPTTVVRKVEGIFYDENFKKISLEMAVNKAYNFTKVGREILIKPNLSTMGMGIKFLQTPTIEELRNHLKSYGTCIIQEAVKQHKEMAYLNIDTVNTIRITTFLLDGEVVPLAALVRVGAPNKRVDNWHQGGSIIGINLHDGSVLPWALGNNIEKITTLPSGAIIGDDGFTKVPSFKSVIELVEKAHYKVPMFKLISWDIAIDENAEPLMLEFNVLVILLYMKCLQDRYLVNTLTLLCKNMFC